MTAYLIRRGLQGLLTLLLTLTAAFFFVQVLMPGDFVSQFAMQLDSAQLDAMRTDLGIDIPIWRQYLLWLGALIRLDLGTGFSGVPVLQILAARLPATLLVFFTGMSIAFTLGLWLGRITAWKGATPLSDGATFTVVAFYAFFPPALAYILREFLGEEWGIFPQSVGYFLHTFERDFGAAPDTFMGPMVRNLVIAGLIVAVGSWALRRFARVEVPVLAAFGVGAGLWAASWYVMGFGPEAASVLWFAGIPILAFVLLSTGEIMVISRTSMAETIHEQYVQTARAKGLSEKDIRNKHAGRNALLPVLSKLVISLPYLLAGLTIIEYVLDWQGVGLTLFLAALQQNVPVFLGFLVVIGGVTLLARITLEVTTAVLDPRIRRS